MSAPITVQLRCSSWQQLRSIYERDLRRSAFFLKSKQPPAIGTPIRIQLTLPSESMVILRGEIREHVAPGGLGGRGPGIDVALESIPQSAMWLIETALSATSATRPVSVTNLEDEQPLPSLSQVMDMPKAPPAAAAAPPPSPPQPQLPVPALEDNQDLAMAEEDLIAALADEYDSLQKLNPFQVLGVAYDTTDDAVRAAFGELAKRYHPDRFRRFQSDSARIYASELFILIRDAYQQLKDAAGRTKAQTQIRGGKQVRPMKPPTLPPIANRPPAPPPAPPPRATTSAGPPAIPPAARKPPPVPPPAPRPPAPPPPTPPAASRVATASEPIMMDDDFFANSDRTDPQIRPPFAGAAGEPRRHGEADKLIDRGDYEAAIRLYRVASKRMPNDATAKAGIELAEGLKALAGGDRLEAAQRFEVVLELEPGNERAARELAEMRRRATNERKGLLTRLLGQAPKK